MIDESTLLSPGAGATNDCAIPNFGHSNFDFQRRPNNLQLNPAAGNMTESEFKHPNVSNIPSNDLNVNLLPVLPRFNGVNDSSASSTNESQKSGDSDAASSHCNSGSPAPQMARSFSQSNSETADPDVQASQRLACDPDIQEKIDLLEREKKVLQYHNQFLKEELESHKKQISELNKTVTELRKRNARYQDILTSYEQLTAVGFKNKQDAFFHSQVSSATSEDNLSEKALTPTSSPSTESESAKGGLSFPPVAGAPPPLSNPSTPSVVPPVPGLSMFQLGSQPNTPMSSNPNLLLSTGDRMMTSPKLSGPLSSRDKEARSPPLLLSSDFKPPSFAYSTTERSAPPEREHPTHIRQRSLQYCIPASPLVGKPTPSAGQVRPSSPAIGEGPTSLTDHTGVAGQNNYTNGNQLVEPFRNGHPAGNARLNSLRSSNTQQKMFSMGRTSSCSERKVAPGPPPRSSGLSKLEKKTDKSCSVPNLNVYGLEQGLNRHGSTMTGHSDNIPSTPKRNNSIIRLFSRKNGANSQNNNQKGQEGFTNSNQSNENNISNHPPNLLISRRDNEDPTSFSQGSTPILGSNAHKRLTHQSSLQNFNENTPFRSWDRKQLSLWLDRLGLGQYISCLPSSINGAALVDAGPHHFEKILGMKNHLHRKKLILAIRSKLSSRPNPVDHIDHNWVIRWLDDIGLPQHKESFAESKIDGRVLYYLTFDDLVSLKVFSAFHQISIGRAVQCLRTQQWNPTCLIRRPLNGTSQNTSSQSPVSFPLPELGTSGEEQRSRKGSGDAGSVQSEDGPEDLLLWTNHRIMDWLRSIDLSEYAPNLRGSGVHGALMCLEPRFLGETLADVLCIPNSKTLLRRHLVSHFNQLVGKHCQELKRMIEVSGHYQPLSPSVRVKCTRRTRRRSRDRGGDLNDLVCPLAFEVPNFVPHSVLPSGYFIRSEDFTNIPMSPSLFLEPSSPARRMNPLQRQSSAGSLEELVACGVYPGDDAFTAESVQDISMLSNQIQSLTTQLSEDPEK